MDVYYCIIALEKNLNQKKKSLDATSGGQVLAAAYPHGGLEIVHSLIFFNDLARERLSHVFSSFVCEDQFRTSCDPCHWSGSNCMLLGRGGVMGGFFKILWKWHSHITRARTCSNP